MSQVIVTPESKASGKLRVVTGEVALDNTNPTPVNLAGRLRTIVAVALTLKASAAPADGTSVLTYTQTGSLLDIYAWKNTGGTDPTLVASTGTETVSYVAIGY